MKDLETMAAAKRQPLTVKIEVGPELREAMAAVAKKLEELGRRVAALEANQVVKSPAVQNDTGPRG
jgi:hypothetical protein